MAYRHLCAVTFAAIGLLAAACSGGAGTAVPSSNNDRTPSNADQPPSNGASDAVSSNNDSAPSSIDRPPSNPDAPAGTGGGNLGALCRDFCDSLKAVSDRCGGDSNGAENDLCDATDCKVPAGYPCGPEAAELFQCLIDILDGLSCNVSGSGNGGGNGNGPQPQQEDATSVCKDAIDKTNACAKAHGLDDGDTDGNMMMPQQRGCYPQGGCECDDACAACTCKANGNTEKVQACFMAGGDCAL